MRLAKLLQRVAVLLAFAVPGPNGVANAQSLPAAKVAVVDYQRVLKDSDAGRDIHRQISAYRKTLQERIKRQEDKLREAEDELKRQRAELKPDDFEKRRRDFEGKVIALQRQAQDWMRALEQTYQEAMSRLHEPLLPLVREMTEQQGYNIVVDNSKVLIVAKARDLTDEVIAQLNKKVPKIQVPKPKIQ